MNRRTVIRCMQLLSLVGCVAACHHPVPTKVVPMDKEPEIPFCESVTVEADGLPSGVSVSSIAWGRCWWAGFQLHISSSEEIYFLPNQAPHGCAPRCPGTLKISRDSVSDWVAGDERWSSAGRDDSGEISRYDLGLGSWCSGIDWNLNGEHMDTPSELPPTQKGVIHWMSSSGKSGEIHLTMELAWRPSGLVDARPPPKELLGCYAISAGEQMFAPSQLELLDRRKRVSDGAQLFAVGPAGSSPSSGPDSRPDDVGDSHATRRCSFWSVVDPTTVSITLSNCFSGLSLLLTQQGPDLIGNASTYWDSGGASAIAKERCCAGFLVPSQDNQLRCRDKR